MHDNGKFLVNLLHGFTHKQIFFAVWFGLVGTFVLLMMAYYRKYTRRNFRSPNEVAGRPSRVDLRRLPGTDSGKKVTVRDQKPPVVR